MQETEVPRGMRAPWGVAGGGGTPEWDNRTAERHREAATQAWNEGDELPHGSIIGLLS